MCNAAEYSVAHGTSIKPRNEGIEGLSDALENKCGGKGSEREHEELLEITQSIRSKIKCA